MRHRLVAALLAALLLGAGGCTRSPGPAAGAATPPAATPGAADDTPVLPARAVPAGGYAVGQRTLAVRRGERQLAVTLWHPRGAAGAAPWPVVLFSHGLGGVPADYGPLLRRWAAAGLVVAAPTYPRTSRGTRLEPLDVLAQPADATAVLDRVLALDRAAGDPLRGRLDTRRVAAAGHSAGGITTIGLFTTQRDPRLRAGIVLAGSTLGLSVPYTGRPAPLLFVHGQQDTIISYATGRAAYDAVPWPKALLTIPDGDHGQTLRAGRGRTFDAVAEATLAFWHHALYGDPTAAARLRPPAAVARLTAAL
ncbi:MAG TPA: chlorophyllase [Pilimelia sp.]|nr:chlorophyllase [Pilimelia sp.]